LCGIVLTKQAEHDEELPELGRAQEAEAGDVYVVVGGMVSVGFAVGAFVEGVAWASGGAGRDEGGGFFCCAFGVGICQMGMCVKMWRNRCGPLGDM